MKSTAQSPMSDRFAHLLGATLPVQAWNLLSKFLSDYCQLYSNI
jgi:hypothetical protein